jgi:hypothetical protein
MWVNIQRITGATHCANVVWPDLAHCHFFPDFESVRIYMGVVFEYDSFRIPHLPSAYCKTTVAQPGFLLWNAFYATLRIFFCAPSHCTCVLCWKDMTRTMVFRVAGTSNRAVLCTTYCTSQNITTDTRSKLLNDKNCGIVSRREVNY